MVELTDSESELSLCVRPGLSLRTSRSIPSKLLSSLEHLSWSHSHRFLTVVELKSPGKSQPTSRSLYKLIVCKSRQRRKTLEDNLSSLLTISSARPRHLPNVRSRKLSYKELPITSRLVIKYMPELSPITNSVGVCLLPSTLRTTSCTPRDPVNSLNLGSL